MGGAPPGGTLKLAGGLKAAEALRKPHVIHAPTSKTKLATVGNSLKVGGSGLNSMPFTDGLNLTWGTSLGALLRMYCRVLNITKSFSQNLQY